MAYKLVCADTGAQCPFEVVADSKDELMQHVQIHAKMAHPEKNPPPPDVIDKMLHRV
ncbi:MAG TPA: DUF1059 domain-containing protein [Vicinamibacterales bacterium]|jgi:predicted small metal-binding protein|nr:DUF1059 domain-containing protein [Vicinamibacterales bacterium]